MSQCVPTWDVDESPSTARHPHRSPLADNPLLDYEVAELTWENGQLALHGLGPPRAPATSPSKYASGGTLESIVNQATRLPKTMDALVPDQSKGRVRTMDASTSIDNNTDYDSLSHTPSQREVGDEEETKKTGGKSSVSTKRSRAAAIHNQSERKRRDKINQRMKTLQKLVPNSSKTDKASMLDEVIEYLKQLQGQVSMMSRMNMPSSSMMMMMPMAMQQQQQHQHQQMMMGMGMGGHVMPNPFMQMPMPMPMAMPMPWDSVSSTTTESRFPPLIPDPITAFLPSSHQPMTMDAYSRMAALYQQMQQQLSPPSNPR